MRPFRITPRQNPARRLSRVHACEAQGVTRRYPARSWSGVRFDDGVVVFALRECDVEGHDDGFSCLLWAPPIEGQWVDRPSRQERLEHCRLALVHGGADGLLVCGDAGLVEPDAILALRVEKRRDEDWAPWGVAARAQTPRGGRDARFARFYATPIAAQRIQRNRNTLLWLGVKKRVRSLFSWGHK